MKSNTRPSKDPWRKIVLALLIVASASYLLLLIPDADVTVPAGADGRPFAWNRDAYWAQLERQFDAARSQDCVLLYKAIAAQLVGLDSAAALLETETYQPESPIFTEFETRIFECGVLIAACPARVNDYVQVFNRIRSAVKQQSTGWDMKSQAARDRIYRLLYGGRLATEEVMLQSPAKTIPTTMMVFDEPSVTPSATLLGVEIHSGDILLSRGSFPTSALIARGSDYPGNFSHVALVYIDDTSGAVSIIESHIEKGMALASLEDYLKDTKLRVLILRLRSSLPAVKADPMLPHRAAKYLFERARDSHVPYDFTMDTQDRSKMFCSEVAAHAYAHSGITLWTELSQISSTGTRAWLSAFGVRNFITEEPSDLEYDPQLSVVAEWRDTETLYKDHMDNAVIDVMLESADSGATLRYDTFMLPVARTLKAYSWILNRLGWIGPVPEGMSATAALKNKWYSRRHRETAARLQIQAREFARTNGYRPPYWELVKLARRAYGSISGQQNE